MPCRWSSHLFYFCRVLAQLSLSITVTFSANCEIISCTVFPPLCFCERHPLILAQEFIYRGSVLLHHLFTLFTVLSAATMSLKSCFVQTCECRHRPWLAECKVVLLPSHSPWHPSRNVKRCACRMWLRDRLKCERGWVYLLTSLTEPFWLQVASISHTFIKSQQPSLLLAFNWTLT